MLPDRLLRAGSSQTGNGQNGALCGLHNSLVGVLHAGLHGGGKALAGGLLCALEALGDAAEQQRKDDARVAPGAPQQRGGGDVGSLGQRGIFGALQICDCVVERHAHIRAGISVGYGEDVQLVDMVLVDFNGGRSADYHAPECRSVDCLSQMSSLRYAPTTMESIKTLTVRTVVSVVFSTM